MLDTKANTSDVKLVKLVKNKIGVGDAEEPCVYLIPKLIRYLLKIVSCQKFLMIAFETLCPPLEGGPKSAISRRGIGQTNNLLFIPCLNPDGMQLGQRTNANGVDLNRNFPTKNWGKNLGDNATCDDEKSAYYGGISAGSEIETQFLIDTISEFKPQIILTLHAPYKVVNYDGPAKELAEKISAIINYPVEASIGYPTPGSFGTYAGVERQISTITLELDEICPVQDLIKPVHEIFDELL